MDLKLKGQRALVTGSTSGIGKGMATKLLQEGVTVYINSFSQQELDDVREELLAVGDARFVKCDVTSTESVTQMMEQIYAEGPLDIIVNNVGWWRDCPFEEITDADWQRMFDLNFFGAVRTLRYVFPRMKERGYGRVLNVASEVAFKPSPDCVHYCAAKTAVVSLSRGLAEATRKTNVTVNSLVYGPCWTPGEAAHISRNAEEAGVSLDAYLEAFFHENEPTSILGRYLQVEELTNTVLYYCSPLSSAVNGTAIRIDGGIIRCI